MNESVAARTLVPAPSQTLGVPPPPLSVPGGTVPVSEPPPVPESTIGLPLPESGVSLGVPGGASPEEHAATAANTPIKDDPPRYVRFAYGCMTRVCLCIRTHSASAFGSSNEIVVN